MKIKIYIDFNNIKCYFNNVKGGEDVERIPDWIMQLEEEDLAFIKNFVLASGSLKEIAGIYGVTYPTVRLTHPENTVDGTERTGALCAAYQRTCYG